jgi:hypothetical protein
MKWLWVCASLAACHPSLGQVPDASIEIDGVQVRTGITASEALLLFKGNRVSRHDKELFIMPGGNKMSAVIVGTLHIDNETIVGACRPWDYFGSADTAKGTSDAELARVLFAAVNGSASAATSQSATVETGVYRPNAQVTVETLVIQMGQRTISVTRQENHQGSFPPFVEVEECLYKPGWTRPLKH